MVLFGKASGSRSKKLPLVKSIIENLNSKRVSPPLAANDYIRVSSFSGVCPREEILRSKLNVPRVEEIEPDLNLIFSVGTGMHHSLQNVVLPMLGVLYGEWLCLSCFTIHGRDINKKLDEAICTRPEKCCKCGASDFLFREHHLLNEEYKITGHPDGFLRLPQYEGTGILEAKSISPKGAWEVRSCPKMDHVFQVQIYLWMTGFTWAQILYWDKGTNGTAGLIEHHIERDDEAISNVLDTITAIRDGIADPSKSLPDRICTASDCPRAEGCPVRVPCFAEGT